MDEEKKKAPQIFHQIFSSHEPSFGPYKFDEIFAVSSPSVFSRQSRHPSVSREARVGRSGDSARERRGAVLLATSGVSRSVKVCREKRRARRQWRELTHADGGHQHCICLKICLVSSPAPNSPTFARFIWEIERPNDGSNRHKFDEKYVLDFLPTSLTFSYRGQRHAPDTPTFPSRWGGATRQARARR